jgi:hypothetical protein
MNPRGIQKSYFLLWRKPQFNAIRWLILAIMMVTPSLPREGEAAQGKHPLDPPFKKFSSTSLEGYRIVGDADAGGQSYQERFFEGNVVYR